MGWCSGTDIFDSVADVLLGDDPVDTKEVLTTIILALEDSDWDCQCDSEYFEHPLVQEIFMELHPNWFEEDEW